MITSDETTLKKSLFQTVLGEQFSNMPAALQALHSPQTTKVWRGEARTRTGNNRLAKFISRFIGLSVPANIGATQYNPLTVRFEQAVSSEKWIRDFNGHIFKSHFTLKEKSGRYIAVENFGLFKFELDLILKSNRLNFIVKRCTFLNLPIPAIILPKGDSFEYEKNGNFHFNVEIRVPIAGLIAAYDGWLKPHKN